jgi:hypothetical protein
MDMIQRRRGTGKTQACIDWARTSGYPILVANNSAYDAIRHRAPDVEVHAASSHSRINSPFVIDELDSVLMSLLASTPIFATLTPDWLRPTTSPLWRPARESSVEAATIDISQYLY